MATTRIKKELRDLAKNPVEGLVVEPSAADMFSWDITIEGPTNTPYEVSLIKFLAQMPSNDSEKRRSFFRVANSNANANFRRITHSKLQN